MEIDRIEPLLSENGIFQIPIVKMVDEDHYDYFLFAGEVNEYLEILKKHKIDYVYIEKSYLTEDEFLYLLDEDEEEVVQKDPLLIIDDEIGAIKMDEVNIELKKYMEHIGKVREITLCAILDGKEFVIKIDQDWNKKLIGRILTTMEEIQERLEGLQKDKGHKKRHN